MNLFTNITKPQQIILIVITAWVSFVGFVALGDTETDYYVFRAVFGAFFMEVFLLCITSPFLYFLRKKN